MSPELLGQLMEAHAAALALYARQWCAAPDDVVQEAFLKLAGQEQLPMRPIHWLFKVVRNAAIDAGRAAARRRKHESAFAKRSTGWFVESDSSGDLDVESIELALARLPLEQREVVVAHLWGGLSFEQIAELNGRSASTAHRWYLDALERIRERLECHARREA